jgi:hypothetical protein
MILVSVLNAVICTNARRHGPRRLLKARYRSGTSQQFSPYVRSPAVGDLVERFYSELWNRWNDAAVEDGIARTLGYRPGYVQQLFSGHSGSLVMLRRLSHLPATE